MSKKLYLNKTERLGMYLNIALAVYNSTLASNERKGKGASVDGLIPKEILAFFE